MRSQTRLCRRDSRAAAASAAMRHGTVQSPPQRSAPSCSIAMSSQPVPVVLPAGTPKPWFNDAPAVEAMRVAVLVRPATLPPQAAATPPPLPAPMLLPPARAQHWRAPPCTGQRAISLGRAVRTVCQRGTRAPRRPCFAGHGSRGSHEVARGVSSLSSHPPQLLAAQPWRRRGTAPTRATDASRPCF